MPTPQWAVELTNQVCKDYKRALPQKFQWYQSKTSSNSSGRTWARQRVWGRWIPSKVHVTAGTDLQDQKLVLLHELAHHICNKRHKREAHSIRFWRLAFELYERYGIDMQYAYEREKDYKQKAQWAFAERTK
jgi:hypothetical protein